MSLFDSKSEFTFHQKYSSDYRGDSAGARRETQSTGGAAAGRNGDTAGGTQNGERRPQTSAEQDGGETGTGRQTLENGAPDSKSEEILREIEEIEAENAADAEKRRQREEARRIQREREEEKLRAEAEEKARLKQAKRAEKEKHAEERRAEKDRRREARREERNRRREERSLGKNGQTSAPGGGKRSCGKKRRRIIAVTGLAALAVSAAAVSSVVHLGSRTVKGETESSSVPASTVTAAVTTAAPTTAAPTTEADPGGIISDKVRGMAVTDKKSARRKISAFAADNGLTLKDYPDFIVEHMVKNQESVEFDLNYPLLKDNPPEIDRSEFSNLKSVPAILQWDERWGYKEYSSSVIGITGCGPTAVSMVAMYLLQDPSLTPDVIADFCVEEGYSITGEGTDWALVSEGVEKLGMSSEQISENKGRVYKELKQKHPIIVVVGPGDFTDDGHFLVLTGIESGEIRLNDPNSRIRSNRLWSWDELTPQINALWVIEKEDSSSSETESGETESSETENNE